MSILNKLKKYLSENSKEKIQQDWKESEKFDNEPPKPKHMNQETIERVIALTNRIKTLEDFRYSLCESREIGIGSKRGDNQTTYSYNVCDVDAPHNVDKKLIRKVGIKAMLEETDRLLDAIRKELGDL